MKTHDKNQYLWWQTGVIYQIYPRSYQDTTGNGVGDLQGIIEHLDYLNDGTMNSLGIDAIWISPFYPSPMADFGYDVADYCDIDPLFGDLDTFDRLVEAAHQRGIKIIIDWVPNHTSDRHPWFIESRKSRDNPKRDWYIWRDPKPDGSPPNNWGSFFGGPAWTFDEQTGQYYMHQFVPEQPELNWRNPDVKAAMLDTLRFWMDRGVDGFRMDVIGLIIKDAQLRDDPLNPDADPNLPANDLHGRLLYVYSQDQDEVHPILKEIRQLVDQYNERVLIGELWGPMDRWVRYYGDTGDEIHLPFNFRLMDMSWSAPLMTASVDEMEAALPAFAWPNYVLGNHDRPRLATRYGGQPQARVAAMMLLTLRGTPTIYYGDELGIENGVIPPHKIQDPQGINLGAHRTRDVCRTPMQWDSSANAGFSSSEPWLPVSHDCKTRNVAAMEVDPDSILNLHRKLLWYRQKSTALSVGTYSRLDLDPDCFTFVREVPGERLFIALNFTGMERQMILPGLRLTEVVISTHPDPENHKPGEIFSLRPFEGVIARLA